MQSSFLKTLKLCSVPDDQKIINEYIKLKKNNNLKWLNVSVLSFFLLFLITYVFFNFYFEFIFLLGNLYFCFFFYILISWINLSKNLNNSFILYEESSWFDVTLWEKPFYLIKNDRLLNTQRIFSIKKRLFNIFFIFLWIFFIYLVL
jgi:hypothetical protein